MFDKTHDLMNHWWWDNPHSIRDEVKRFNPRTTISGKVKHTGKHLSWYCSDDPRAKIEPPSCLQYKPADFLAVRPLNSDAIIDEDDDDENWAHPGVPGGGRSHPTDGNDNYDCEG